MLLKSMQSVSHVLVQCLLTYLFIDFNIYYHDGNFSNGAYSVDSFQMGKIHWPNIYFGDKMNRRAPGNNTIIYLEQKCHLF